MTNQGPTLPDAIRTETLMRLGRLEVREEMLVLLAVESGSRAWGCPSPDSDYDVRFIYIRPLRDYVRLTPKRDVIEVPIADDWDINGWDLRKAVQLLVKGNATVTEWLSSPLVYREFGDVATKLGQLIEQEGSAHSMLLASHYYGLTKSCYKRDIFGHFEVKQKKYLYAIRGALSIQYIAAYNTTPPITFRDLLWHRAIPNDVMGEVTRILDIKAISSEAQPGPRIKILDEFIEKSLVWAEENALGKAVINPAFEKQANEILFSALGVP